MRSQAAVEHDRTVIVRAVVPDVFKQRIGLAHLLHEGSVEGKEFLLHGIAARELRVVAHTVHAVISVKLCHLFSTYGCDICQYRAPTVCGQAAERNAGNARNGHAVLVRHVEECAGHAAERSRPVAPVRHVGPHGEYFGVEHAVG